MWANYFIYNNKRYEYGTIVKAIIQNEEAEMTFITYNTEEGKYLFKIDANHYKDGYYLIDYTDSELRNNLVEITDRIDTKYVQWHPLQEPLLLDRLTFKEELKVDGLFIGWVWYIFLMGITIILNGRLFYWAVISICFYNYRKKRLKEEGYK